MNLLFLEQEKLPVKGFARRRARGRRKEKGRRRQGINGLSPSTRLMSNFMCNSSITDVLGKEKEANAKLVQPEKKEWKTVAKVIEELADESSEPLSVCQ